MIVMACATFPPEPVVAASLTYDLATELARNHQVRVLTPRPTRPYGFSFSSDTARRDQFKQVILPSYTCPKSCLLGRMWESYSFGRHVSRYIRENSTSVDVVYICAWPLLAQYMIAKTANRLGLKSVVHVEDIYPESLSNKIPAVGAIVGRLLMPLDAFSLRMATQVVAVSDNMMTRFIRTRGISSNKIALVYNWQEEDVFLECPKELAENQVDEEPDKVFTFMYLGNIGPVAGVDFVVRTFAEARIPNARLVVAGAGSMREQCRKIADGYGSCIEFWDVPQGKVPETQAQADVMLLPVKCGAGMSSIPSKLLAYLFSKKPVIACVDPDSDTAQTIRKADCGWVLPPENPDELTKLLKTVVGLPPQTMKQYGLNGFIYARKHFSRQRNLNKLVRLIRKNL